MISINLLNNFGSIAALFIFIGITYSKDTTASWCLRVGTAIGAVCFAYRSTVYLKCCESKKVVYLSWKPGAGILRTILACVQTSPIPLLHAEKWLQRSLFRRGSKGRKLFGKRRKNVSVFAPALTLSGGTPIARHWNLCVGKNLFRVQQGG